MNRQFFIISAIHFEEDTEKEVRLLLSHRGIEPETTKVKGGVELNCPLGEGLALNQRLKVATRILLRIDEFPVYFFNELEKRLKKIDFRQYFPRGAQLLIKVDSKKSKLGQEKRIFEVFKNVFVDYKLFSKPSEAPADSLILYVDIFKDNCRLSFDTTGEALYKRSLNKFNAEAPIRETIAHWGMNRMIELFSPWSCPMKFVDPFCGSGTIPLEVIHFFSPLARPFSFEKVFKIEKFNLPMDKQHFPFLKYEMADIDDKSLNVCMKNFEKIHSHLKLEFSVVDACLPKSNSEDIRSWIFTNLPYGKRVNDKLPINLTEILYQNYKPKIMGLFYPEKLNHSQAIKSVHIPLENGGIRVYLSILLFA